MGVAGGGAGQGLSEVSRRCPAPRPASATPPAGARPALRRMLAPRLGLGGGPEEGAQEAPAPGQRPPPSCPRQGYAAAPRRAPVASPPACPASPQSRAAPRHARPPQPTRRVAAMRGLGASGLLRRPRTGRPRRERAARVQRRGPTALRAAPLASAPAAASRMAAGRRTLPPAAGQEPGRCRRRPEHRGEPRGRRSFGAAPPRPAFRRPLPPTAPILAPPPPPPRRASRASRRGAALQSCWAAVAGVQHHCQPRPPHR